MKRKRKQEKDAFAEEFASYATSILYFEDLLRDRDNVVRD